MSMAYSGYQAMPMSLQYSDVSKGLHYSPPSAPSTPAMTPQPSPHPMPLPMPSPLLTSVAAPDTVSDSPMQLPRGRGSWCKRFSHVNSSGAMCTSTAWAPEPQAKETIKLGPEMRQLYNLVTRTSTEMAAAEGARFTLQSILFNVWQDTTVKMCGSEVFRLGLPGAPLQVVAEHCGDVQQSICAMQERGLLVQPGSHSARVTVSGVEVDLTFEEGSSVARLRSRALKKLVDKFPDAPIIACVINTRLGQSRYDGPNQGFSVDATLAMVLHLCQRRQRDQEEQEQQPQPTDDELEPGRTLATQLLSFFEYYEKFDFKKFSVVADSPDPVPRPDAHSEAQVSVLCPVSGENMAHACVKLMRIQVMYQHCHQALAKYDGVPVGQKRGYKGRTPLATIVSIEPLWPRAREIGIAPPETKPNLPGSTPTSSGLSSSSISLPSPTAMPLPKPSIPIDLPDLALSP